MRCSGKLLKRVQDQDSVSSRRAADGTAESCSAMHWSISRLTRSKPIRLDRTASWTMKSGKKSPKPLVLNTPHLLWRKYHLNGIIYKVRPEKPHGLIRWIPFLTSSVTLRCNQAQVSY